MELDKLRKADFFSGAVVIGVGLFIISQGLQMPMKDSWGGVQNVWYVSPALFPLFVGAMLVLLGLLLMRTAVKAVGIAGVKEVLSYLGGSDFGEFLKRSETIRFYGVVVNLLVFVFIMVPRVDFFIAAVLFLLTCFFMYYCGDLNFLKRSIWIVLGWALGLVLLVLAGLPEKFSYLLDVLSIGAIVIFSIYTRKQIDSESLKKFRLSLLIGLVAPLTVGVIFKFLLLVPLPHEGMIVHLLDAIWYADFWYGE